MPDRLSLPIRVADATVVSRAPVAEEIGRTACGGVKDYATWCP